MLFASPAAAQGGLSLWLGAGRPVARDSVSWSLRNLDAYGALQLDLPVLPFALRGDATVGGGDLRDGRRNVSASAVFPLRMPLLEPYGMVGYGIYDWGKAFEQRGVNYGAGLRLRVARLGVFAQVRRDQPLRRSVGTMGVTF